MDSRFKQFIRSSFQKMKIIIEQIKTSITAQDNDIFEIAKARINKTRAFALLGDMYIYKRSIDARNKE